MDGRAISGQLRLAVRDSGLTLWEVARRAELSVADAAQVLGHAMWPPVELVESVGYALGLELAFRPAHLRHAVSEPRTVVDEAIARVAPERLSHPGTDKSMVLALDLEGTLISSAAPGFTRPGLYEFLDAVHGLFGRVVLFTALAEPKFRELAVGLLQEGQVPPWFVAIECVRWTGATKDLDSIFHVTAEQVLLVDDLAQAVHPGQESQWVEIGGFGPPFDEHDDELSRVLEVLVDRVVGRKAVSGVRS